MSPSDEPSRSLWTAARVLIWGKTYPELSTRYVETVCTGGTTQDGKFIRLYPIPFRYLSNKKLFSKYQWIEAQITKSTQDPRPESYKIDCESMTAGEFIPSEGDGWGNRAKDIFKDNSHLFVSAEALMAQHEKTNQSMGFVKPAEILGTSLEARPKEDYEDFKKKMKINSEKNRQADLFESPTASEIKSLMFMTHRFKVRWRCDNPQCRTHNMSILDWEPYELARKEGYKKALAKVNEILDLDVYDLGFFLGNFKLHPANFAIGSIWYPKRSRQTSLLAQFGKANT